MGIYENKHLKIVSAERLKGWIKIAIDENYLTVGNGLFRQTCGIPMGMNAASFMSNLFMFMYELQFMEQFLKIAADSDSENETMDDDDDEQAAQAAQAPRAIRDWVWETVFLKYFKYIKRYQDDRWAAKC